MERAEFQELCMKKDKPTGLNRSQLALWYDSRGDIAVALETLHRERGPMASRIRAYLHRKSGDTSNASYWYKKSGVRPQWKPLEQERADLVELVVKAC